MLSVEERHVLAVAYEAASTANRAVPEATAHPVDSLLAMVKRRELRAREFYDALNGMTRWSEHPAVAEPVPARSAQS